ncbi:MAG: BTAD domain-containing putative transcriptional regulator [bacterium]|nr:BTAD domain-containing putative transcriptional regulator [bacterium]
MLSSLSEFQPVWQVRLFGGLHLTHAAHHLVRFRTRKTGALLAYLAFHRGQPHPRERLVDLFWPDADGAAGRDSLSTALASLRRQLEPPDVIAGSVIAADRQQVTLSAAAVQTDVEQFEALVKAALTTLPFPVQMRQLSQAFGLYGGTLLPEYADDWIEPQRQRLREQYVLVLRRLLALLYADTRFNEAMTTAQRALALEPDLEAVHYHLLEAMAQVHEFDLLHAHYQHYRHMLRHTLAVEPSDRIQALAESAAPRRARGMSVMPLPTPTPLTGGLWVLILIDDAAGADAQDDLSHARTWRRTEGQIGLAFERLIDAVTWLAAHVGTSHTRTAVHLGENTPDGIARPAVILLEQMAAAAHAGQCLCSDVIAQLLQPADAGASADADTALRFVRLGTYRFMTDQAALMVYQVEKARSPAQPFPPLKALPGLKSNLPVYLTRFYGRESIVQHAEHLLRTRSARLITLTGTGGIGKTRTAVHIASAFTQTDSVIFVPMTNVGYVEFIPDMILEHLPNVDVTRRDSHTAIVELLDRHDVLLILDSFEHLADGGGFYLERLLGQASRLRLIVTSQRRLGVPGEHELLLPALETPAHAGELTDLFQQPAAALFVDRAQHARPDFQLTAANAQAVAELCRRLDGIPLALELAAARSQVFTPSQMLDQLADRFSLLVDRKRRPDDPHRALSAAIAWSCALLTPPQQRAFAHLSIFRSSWDVTAAQHICALPDAASILEALAAHSLIRAFESGGAMRFHMYETLRAYGWEQLDAHQRDHLAEQHTRYYRAWLETAAHGVDAMETEMEHFRAVMWRTLEPDPETYLLTAAHLLPLWRGKAAYLREGRHWLEQGLRYVTEAQRPITPAVRDRAAAAFDVLGQVPSIRIEQR